MSPIVQDVQTDIILPGLKAASCKQVLQTLISEVGLRTGLDPRPVFQQLFDQEQRSTSGIGGGVAIPHLQMAGLTEAVMILARLEHPVDFHSIDNHHVDLVFLLVSPLEDGPLHLRRLSRISRTLKNENICAELRAAKDAHVMRAILGMPENWLMAA